MGIFTVYCAVTGVPLEVVCDLPEEDKKKYQWCRPVVVLEDGSVTEPGYYDSYGRVIVNNKTYKVIGYDMEEEIEHDGIAISQKTYEIMKPTIEQCFGENDNLYQKILKNRHKDKIGMIEKYVGSQQIIITTEDKKNNYHGCVVDGTKESLEFQNPDTCQENFCRMDDLCSFILLE
jgi:hypothetical protein